MSTSSSPLVKDCRGCEAQVPENKIIKKGVSEFGKEKKVEWILKESRRKGAETHYIFTTISHHVGPNQQELRGQLLSLAYKVASQVLDHFRLVLNTGGSVSSVEHFHVHIIKPGKEERLVRAVANVGNVIEKSELSKDQKEKLSSALLQRKN